MLSQFKWSKDELSTLEVDWASSDKPICLMSDGTVRVFDIKMSLCSSCHGYNEYRGECLCVYMYTCMCVYIEYMCVYVCVHVCTCISVCVHVCTLCVH